MAELALTNVYLEQGQKKALARKAKANNSNLSSEIRAAVNAYLAGVTAEDVELLDAATRQAKSDIDEMLAILENGQKRANAFFAEIERIKAEEGRARS